MALTPFQQRVLQYLRGNGLLEDAERLERSFAAGHPVELLTVFQLSVIQRLKDAGHSRVADEAYARWSVRERVGSAAVADIQSAELRNDFEKANAQATRADRI
jgi:hypothetical protein